LRDGRSIERIGLEIVRENVVTVLQHPVLFNEFYSRQSYFGVNPSDAALMECTGYRAIDGAVKDLPNGLDTIVGRLG